MAANSISANQKRSYLMTSYMTKVRNILRALWCMALCAWTANAQSSKFQFSGDRKTLTISSLCKNDCGADGNDLMVIQCNAINEHGYALANGYVNVFGQLLSFIVYRSVPCTFLTTQRYGKWNYSCLLPTEVTRFDNILCAEPDGETRLVADWLRNKIAW